MERLNYKGDLKKDIENSKIKFSSAREIVNRIVTISLQTPLFILFSFCYNGYSMEVLEANKRYFAIGFSLIQVIIQSLQYNFNKNRRNKIYNESNYRLENLGARLDIDKNKIQDAIILEDESKETKRVNDKKYSKDTLVRRFYCLNNQDKISVLKYVREIVKVKENGKSTKDVKELLYLVNEDDEELSVLKMPVQVVKKLELF